MKQKVEIPEVVQSLFEEYRDITPELPNRLLLLSDHIVWI